ncbi:hypothetical protein V1264_017396 [Littorina saxatilis]|uniref:Uncharacterized protein n=1 Tax=Littorina saxatilis TaxID=31220 RepID=A0AAN9GFQ6_9CAEN
MCAHGGVRTPKRVCTKLTPRNKSLAERGDRTHADSDQLATKPARYQLSYVPAPVSTHERKGRKRFLLCVQEENAEEKDEEDELEAEKKSQQRVNSHFQEIEALVRQEGLRLEALKLRLDEHEQECERRHEWVTETLAQKVDGGELTLFKDAVRLQLYNFVNKRTPYGPAGAKQQIKVNCLSCDKKSYTTAVPAERTLPQAGAFPPVISQRPHTVYETDIIRRHGRSLLEGKTGGPDFYSLQRSCGGQHTSIDVRQTWTYEIHQKESLTKGGDGRLNPGGATHSPSKKGTRGTRSTEQLVAQMQFHNPPRP